MKRVWTLTIALLLTAMPAASEAGEMIDNPEYTSWKGYKVGTSITHRMTTQAGPSKTKMETTTTLKSKGKDKLVLTTKAVTFITIPNQGEQKVESPAQERTVPAKFEMPKMPDNVPDMPKPEMKEGEETIKAAGKSFKCKWIETKIKMGEMTTTSKTWTSKEVPGQLVKMTSSSTGAMATSTESILIELKTP